MGLAYYSYSIGCGLKANRASFELLVGSKFGVAPFDMPIQFTCMCIAADGRME